MNTSTRTLAIFGIWVACFALLWIGISSNDGNNKTETTCAQIWEKYGEERGAACFDAQHLKEKQSND